MYYPILRGRQNEMLAIKELLNNSVLSSKIVPVIEPVKLTATVVNTMKTFADAGRELAIIKNPGVGAFSTDWRNSKNQQYRDRMSELLESGNIKKGLIIDKSVNNVVTKWHENGTTDSDIIVICNNPDMIKFYELTFQSSANVRTIVPYAPAFRRIRKNRILLEDKFNKKTRNQDYKLDPDEFFSNDHIYYADDGYIGFSDYSIIGNEYSESGFAPYAVAIHIVYFDSDKNLRIHHFVSDTNDDISDPAQKFYEAVTQLVEWNKEHNIDTIAMKTFEKIYAEQSYPGLGVIKKLSLMHHLELIGRYLDRQG